MLAGGLGWEMMDPKMDPKSFRTVGNCRCVKNTPGLDFWE